MGIQYSKKIKLMKQYKGSVKYQISLEGKSSKDLTVDLSAQGNTLSSSGNLIKAEMKDQDEVELEVKILSKACGPSHAFFYVDIEDGAPLSFQV
jgi:hypothetical protein